MKATWLFSKHPITIDTDLATSIGLNEAIVLQQLNYWLHSKSVKIINDRRWIYNTYNNWKKDSFPFWSVMTIRRTFNSLVKSKLIIAGNFNKAGFDKTKWYSIDEAALEELMNRRCVQNEQTICSKRTDGTVQNEHTNTRDYTETTTETNKTYSSSSEKPPKEEHHIPYKEIIDYLNQKAGTEYRATTKATKTLIKARWNEGNTLDDFKKVIDNQAYEWQGTKFWKYMRPATLFASKFEGYLNANVLDKEKELPHGGFDVADEPSIDDLPDDLPF